MDNITNDTKETVIIIYKGYSLAQKKASAKYYQANKEKCIALSRKWAIAHKDDEKPKKEVPKVEKEMRKIYNARCYMKRKQEQEQEQEQA